MKRKLYPYKCISVDGEFYVFTSRNNRLINIPYIYYEVLMQGEKNDFFVEICNEDKQKAVLIEDFERFELFENEESEKYCDDEKIYSLVLLVAQDCNLNCKYCYGQGGEYHNKGKMSKEVAKAAIDFFVSQRGKRNKLYITFFGGEPLLNMELIRNIVEYIEQIEKNENIFIGKSMTTNGTLITDEIAEYCENKKINIKISIDGPEEINDQLRVYKNGRGSYKDIINRTQKLREKKLVSARATITPLCLNREHIEMKLIEAGFTNVGSAFADELFCAEDYLRVYKLYADGLEKIKEIIEKKQFEQIKTLHIRSWGYLFNIHASTMGIFNCGSGRNMYAVDINGDLYPCHRFVGREEYILGNVFKGVKKREEFLKQININNKKRIQCQKCWIKNFCLGMCPYTYFVAFNEREQERNIVCSMNKALYEDAAKLYLKLSEEEKKSIFHTDLTE